MQSMSNTAYLPYAFNNQTVRPNTYGELNKDKIWKEFISRCLKLTARDRAITAFLKPKDEKNSKT